MGTKKNFSQNIQEKANTLFLYMREKNDYVTKDEICTVTGCTNERSAREVVAALATVKPIISTSDNKGYKLARTRNDLVAVVHSLNELTSRQNELERRKAPLEEFFKAKRGMRGKR